jgi:methionyl-tRNA synthetase
MSQDTFYITTPIYYVNDAPHLGHAYTTVAADAISRYQRMKGKDVFFLTGTDEHGQKVFRAAQKRGITAQEHVDNMAAPYKALWKHLEVQYDDFIRTTEERHTRVVQSILERLKLQGDIYQDSYKGWYSTAEERFWTEKDLIDGKCPASGQPVELIEEHNYFFRMSKYADKLSQWIEDHPDFIQPASRKNEVLGALKKGVGDLCITRPTSRLPWGIPIPWDNDYVTYVWFDALTNYISAPGFGSDEARFRKWWPANFHLVGKDILTTHSIYWSTMLFALGEEPANCLYAHGWWTVEGQKMSKTIGNVVKPHLLIDAYGPDAVRYFLMREIAFGSDGDFAHSAFLARYNAELANDFGNLAHRALSMSTQWLGGKVPALGPLIEDDQTIQALALSVVNRFDQAMERLQYKEAYGVLMELVGAGNKYIDTQAPWALNKAGNMDRLGTVMRIVLEICRITSTLFSPVCTLKGPQLLERLGVSLPDLDPQGLAQLGQFSGLPEGGPLTHGEPLFPRISELPASIAQAMDSVDLAPKKASLKQKKRMSKPKTTTPKEAKVSEENASEKDALINFDDFTKIQFRTGTIVSAEKHPNADRLLVLKVDVGEDVPRTIVAGIAGRYAPEDLTNQTVIVVVNLKPVKLRGILSEGMLLAAGGGDVKGLVTLVEEVDDGTIVR